MTSTAWYERADRWQDRLERLPRNTDRTIRLHNRLHRGIIHAMQMGALCRRLERGCGHEDGQRICDDCLAAL